MCPTLKATSAVSRTCCSTVSPSRPVHWIVIECRNSHPRNFPTRSHGCLARCLSRCPWPSMELYRFFLRLLSVSFVPLGGTYKHLACDCFRSASGNRLKKLGFLLSTRLDEMPQF